MNRKRINRLILASILVGSFISYPVKAQETGAKEQDMESPFGVLEFLHWNHSWNDYKYSCPEDLNRIVKLMKEAGVGIVRMDFLWEDIEPEEGEFDFEKYDTIVNILAENNIKVLGVLQYSAGWASSCGKWNCPPTDNKLFLNYVSKVIERYKDFVKYWELWNEPDSPTYWSPQDGLKSYSVLLKEVYLLAKKIDPQCKILNGGLANGISSVNRLYSSGSKDYFDIFNIHIFYTPLAAGSLKAVTSTIKLTRKIMDRNNDRNKKIWVTEIGCPGVKVGKRIDNWWLGKNPSEKQQSEWLTKVYDALLKGPMVEKVFWAFFRDCQGHWNNGIDYFGIVRWDYSKKPAFNSYKKCYLKWRDAQ